MFSSEKEVEVHVRGLIAKLIESSDKEFVLLNHKDVIDIIVCENNESPKLYFLEIKFYKPKSYRLGFGSAKGKGLQPEILLKKPHYFENNMRWLICRIDDPNFYWFTNSELRNYLSAGKIGDKYNNFQHRKLFSEKRGLSIFELESELKEWFGIKT